MNHEEFKSNLDAYKRLEEKFNQKYNIKSLGKEIKPKLLDWGDLLKMEGPTMQELCDEFHRRYPDEK